MDFPDCADKKKDFNTIDYRSLNNIIIKNGYQQPQPWVYYSPSNGSPPEPTKWLMANVNKMKLHLALVIVR